MSHASTADLLERCRAWLHRYLILTPAQEIVIAVWVLHTWAIDAADYTPYLHITAPEKSCGKTRVLETLQPIVCRPWLTGRVTAAVLSRKTAKEKPTLLLDESDAAFKGPAEYSEALRGLLNSGFNRNGVVSLCTGKGADISTVDLPCFGPKAIAGIGDLPDTIASRSIVIAMRRKTAGERVERFRGREVKAAAEELTIDLEEWASPQLIESLRAARPQLPEQLTDRQMDIVETLLAIADFAGAGWPEQLRVALLELFGSVTSEDTSIGVLLLRDIRTVFEERGVDVIFSEDLASALCEMEGQPWSDWMHGKGLDYNGIAGLVKKYEIKPKTVRIGDLTLKGYRRDWFEDVWTRYCPPDSPTAVTSVTAVTTRVNVDDSRYEIPSHSHQNGAFAAQKAAFPLSRFHRHTSEYPHAENPRQSSIVTGVTAVTAVTAQISTENILPCPVATIPLPTDTRPPSREDVVRRVFGYYLERTERYPKRYTLTDQRMKVGLARLEDCLRMCDGDLAEAEARMNEAIDALARSKYHQGLNDRHCEYTDWSKHLFPDIEKLEWWLER